MKAARIVTGGNRLAPRYLYFIYKETDWEPLSKRREYHRLIQLHIIYYNLHFTPDYLSNIIQSQKSQGHNLQYRSNESSVKKNEFQDSALNSFFPATIRKWNALPQSLQLNPSLSTFKTYLYSYRIKIPNYFYIVTRIRQILHSKLRLECSTLNLHMFQRKFRDSPLCNCGKDHFLLHWNIFKTEK